MNQHLQYVMNLLQQDKSISGEEKNAIVKSLKDADKELEITTSELEQKRKAVEAQAKESRIETALERLRAVAMAMKISDDLLCICEVLYKELVSLGFSELRNALIASFGEGKDHFDDYDYSDDTGGSISYVPYNSHPIVEAFVKKLRSSPGAFSELVVDESELNSWKEYRKRNGQPVDPRLDKCSSLHYYMYSIGISSIGISAFSPLAKDKVEVLERFANVFKLAYQRYIDISLAEAQAKEAQIQLALERVRARTMAMQQSEELSDTSLVLFQQLKELGEPAEQLSIGIIKEAENIVEVTVTLHGTPLTHVFRHNIDEPRLMNKIYKNWKAQEKILVVDMQGEELEAYNKYRNELIGSETFTPNQHPGDRRVVHSAFFSKGMLALATNEPRPEESLQLLQRFAKVFDGTYTRFLDLQKAEAQAKEAQIELGLERVRARAMAMQTSEELNALSGTVFTELTKLDLVLTRCVIMIYDPLTNDSRWWMANSEAPEQPMNFPVQNHEQPPYTAFIKAWQERQVKWVYTLEGKTKKVWDDFLFTETGLSQLPDFVIAGMKEPERVYLNSSFFNFGNISLPSLEPLPNGHFDIMLRFAKVFDLTYTRFNDLKLAEAQTREAQIEVGLERVRAKAMAMHNSQDVSIATAVMFNELTKLGVENMRCGVGILNAGNTIMDVWTATVTKEGHDIKGGGVIDTNKHQLWVNMRNDWKAGKESFFYHLAGEDLKAYYKALTSSPNYSAPYIKDDPPEHYCYVTYFEDGVIFTFNYSPYSEEQKQVLKRFAAVFDLTYKRYKDLKKAEAQAREAQIEASLERVRSKAMSMQKSEDLANTVALVFEELDKLSLGMLRCGIGILNKEKRCAQVWTTSKSDNDTVVQVSGDESMDIHPLLRGAFESWIKQEDHSYILQGEDLNNYYKAVARENFKLPDSQSLVSGSEGIKQYYYNAVWSSGGLFAFRETEFPEEAKIVLRRFADVFDFTYTRFNDLKQAEAQAKEARIEVALERVRSRTLAMQKSDELAETAAVLFRQLINLGIAPNRLYICIVKDDNGEAEFWITDEDGSKVSSAFETNLNDNTTFKRMFAGWKTEKKSLVIDMQGNELQEYFKYLTTIEVPFKGGLEQKRRVQDIAYFSKGFIGIASPDEQPEETRLLLERFAAVFNLTYTRFNDLKIAEAHAVQAEEDLIKLQTEKKRAEDALTELRSTQKQLIQSEKMASLGELTAGIAHEIQNPLNFVNNFSEVSKELLDEMREAIEKGDTEDAKEIMNDVIQNLEKINHHGKRADGIVKGMLQHSRASSATKELTDINKLADEYLRLAYHGLRAKDKSFNATLKTDYDEGTGSINIIPQDIGRVILNLITNAFYAVGEKKKQAAAQGFSTFERLETLYEPIVSLSTKKINDKVEIRVADNGNGIPTKVLDKIFQPFFTTKPTGQGTGLGLSLAYDIVKAHGGELKVETKEQSGTTFSIQLPIH